MKIIRLLRQNFFAGVLVLIPMVVIFWIFEWVFNRLWQLRIFVMSDLDITSQLSPEAMNLLEAAGFVASIIVIALLISILGFVSKLYLGQKVLAGVSVLLKRVPVIGAIYSSLDQLLRTLTSSKGGQQFRRVVYIEFPHKGIWAIAFVTGACKLKNVPAGHLNVFIPAVPNPTSGFHLIVPESDVRETNMSVEEAFKTILSLGLAQTEAT
jgi:uncharacterized membrane protein